MTSNYELRRALYRYLNIKFSNDEKELDANTRLKLFKITDGFLINMFIITKEHGNIYLNNLNKSSAKEYYSDLEINLYYKDNIIYLNNESNSTIQVISFNIEVTKGLLLETFFEVEDRNITTFINDDKILEIDNEQIKRLLFEENILAFKEEFDLLKRDFNTFKNTFNNWKETIRKFAYIDKLTSENIEEYIEGGAIVNSLISDGTIKEEKLHEDVVSKLTLGNTSVQKINFNGSVKEPVDGTIDINALNKIKIMDYINNEYKDYNVDSTGKIEINDWDTYIQPLLEGTKGDLLYFIKDNEIGSKPIDDFLLKNDIVNDFDGENVSDEKVPSSELIDLKLNEKINKTAEISSVNNGFVKITTNEFGLVTDYENVDKDDLTNLIGDTYLTKSYEWNENTGTLKLK